MGGRIGEFEAKVGDVLVVYTPEAGMTSAEACEGFAAAINAALPPDEIKTTGETMLCQDECEQWKERAEVAEKNLSEIGSVLRVRGINVAEPVTSAAVLTALKEAEAHKGTRTKSPAEWAEDLEEQMRNQSAFLLRDWNKALREVLTTRGIALPETFTIHEAGQAIARKRDEDAEGFRARLKAAAETLGELAKATEAERDEARGALAKALDDRRQILASLEMAAALIRQLGSRLLIAPHDGKRAADVHVVAMAQLWLQAAARGELPSVEKLLKPS